MLDFSEAVGTWDEHRSHSHAKKESYDGKWLKGISSMTGKETETHVFGDNLRVGKLQQKDIIKEGEEN